MPTLKAKVAVSLWVIVLPILSGCVSDDYPYDRTSEYSRNYYGTPEQRDHPREAWQRQQARWGENHR
ncbi:Uncharacterised protein [Agrobacterium tumefaciens]|nr:Uncharacterised protein [Agrobacterium tumefaciens]